MRLLYPERRPTSPAGARYRPAPRRQGARRTGPTSVLNMVSSLDGKATIDWRTKGLSTELDRRLFHRLRTQADAIMVGAGTVRAERYGRMAKSDELRDARVGEGLAPDPVAVVISARLDLPADLPLLNEPAQRVVIATHLRRDPAGLGAAGHLRAHRRRPAAPDGPPARAARRALGRSARAARRSTRTCSPPGSSTSSCSRSTRRSPAAPRR